MQLPHLTIKSFKLFLHVLSTRLELALFLKELAPQASVSTNFTTRAYFLLLQEHFFFPQPGHKPCLTLLVILR